MRRAPWILLLVFVFTIPWEYSLDFGEPFGNIARIAGLVLLAAAVPVVVFEGHCRTPGATQTLALALFLWSCCSCFWTIDRAATLARMRGDAQVMMIVWLAWEVAGSADDLRDLLRAFVAGSWVLAALTLASLASPDAAGQIRFVAEGQDPNDVARFLDLGLPMAALLLDAESHWAGKLLAFGYLPVGLLGVLVTASRGGFLAALVALAGCVFLIARSHLRAAAAMALSLPAFAIAVAFAVPRATLERIATIQQQLQGGDLNQRLNIWQAGWQAFAHAPCFGSGAGTFVAAARLAPADTAHNSALAIAVEGGLVALILAAAMVTGCMYSAMQTRGPLRIAFVTALLVWIVTALVATVEGSRITWLLFALIALAGRIAVEDPGALEKRFPGVSDATLDPEERMA